MLEQGLARDSSSQCSPKLLVPEFTELCRVCLLRMRSEKSLSSPIGEDKLFSLRAIVIALRSRVKDLTDMVFQASLLAQGARSAHDARDFSCARDACDRGAH